LKWANTYAHDNLSTRRVFRNKILLRCSRQEGLGGYIGAVLSKAGADHPKLLASVEAHGYDRPKGRADMEQFNLWWGSRSKAEVAACSIACLVFIFVAAIDIGRALYQATH
jgi:hypothetical protein